MYTYVWSNAHTHSLALCIYKYMLDVYIYIYIYIHTYDTYDPMRMHIYMHVHIYIIHVHTYDPIRTHSNACTHNHAHTPTPTLIHAERYRKATWERNSQNMVFVPICTDMYRYVHTNWKYMQCIGRRYGRWGVVKCSLHALFCTDMYRYVPVCTDTYTHTGIRADDTGEEESSALFQRVPSLFLHEDTKGTNSLQGENFVVSIHRIELHSVLCSTGTNSLQGENFVHRVEVHSISCSIGAGVHLPMWGKVILVNVRWY